MRCLRIAVLAIAAIPGLVAWLPGQGDYNKERHSQLGIEFLVHRKLAAVPLQIGTQEPHLRARYQPNDPSDRIAGKFSWELFVLEFQKPGSKPPSRASRPAAASQRTARNFEHWVHELDLGKNQREFLTEGEVRKARRATPEHRYYEYHDVDARFGYWYHLAAVYDFDDHEVALLVNMPARGRPKLSSSRRQIARTMLTSLMPLAPGSAAEKTDAAAAARDSFANTPRRQTALAAAKANIANLGHWNYFTMPNYIVLYSWNPKTPNKKDDAYKIARGLAEELEEFRAHYERDFPPHDKMVEMYPVLRVCEDHDEFRKYGDPADGVVGWFNKVTQELVIFDDKTRVIDQVAKGAGVKATCFHEGWHQYASSYFGPRTVLHGWFDEGVGEYFGAFHKRGKQWRYGVHKTLHSAIRRQVAKRTYLALDEFFHAGRDEFSGKRTLDRYAQAYALVDFLCRGPDRLGRKFDPKWNAIIPTYTAQLLKTRNRKTALKKALQGVDFQALEAAWTSWVKSKMK